MQALGTLAGGIAHDFNNILTAIVGNAHLALSDLSPAHPAEISLTEIAKAGTRATELVRRILMFSRQQETQRVVTPLQPVIEEALKLLRASLPAMIHIRSSYSDDLPKVSADATQIHQIVMNLGTNAAHAMGEKGGLLKVEVDHLMVDEDLASTSADLREGHYVRIVISDTGCGMTQGNCRPDFRTLLYDERAQARHGLGSLRSPRNHQEPRGRHFRLQRAWQRHGLPSLFPGRPSRCNSATAINNQAAQGTRGTHYVCG